MGPEAHSDRWRRRRKHLPADVGVAWVLGSLLQAIAGRERGWDTSLPPLSWL